MNVHIFSLLLGSVMTLWLASALPRAQTLPVHLQLLCMESVPNDIIDFHLKTDATGDSVAGNPTVQLTL